MMLMWWKNWCEMPGYKRTLLLTSFKLLIFKLIQSLDILSITCKVALVFVPQDHADD